MAVPWVAVVTVVVLAASPTRVWRMESTYIVNPGQVSLGARRGSWGAQTCTRYMDSLVLCTPASATSFEKFSRVTL